MTISAPLAYRTFATSLKYPTLGNNVDPVYQDITSDTPYTSKIFNKKNNQKYYSQAEMENDFKYFNNASNVGLSQMFNVEDTEDATQPMPADSEPEHRNNSNQQGIQKLTIRLTIYTYKHIYPVSIINRYGIYPRTNK